MTTSITNPILPGFFPDPSIVRTGEWFYVANSSFEWFPTIPIHRSRDLANWEFAGSLNGPDVALDFSGIQDSGCIWAPSLSWDGGMFWLTFTVVRSFGGNQKDMDTYVTRAPDVAGPWSAPARVTSTGFDPSIFHHEGRHWLANMEWDNRPNGRGGFAGINVQELTADGSATLGTPQAIFRSATLIEGPNLYFRDGWYYLMTAEGGTGFNHGILMLRSRELLGPYEADPDGSLLTSRDDDTLPLQKAGHGELVTTEAGEDYLVHLASRWIESDGDRRAILGRETCIQRVCWTPEGWLRLEQGGRHAAEEVPAPSGLKPALSRLQTPSAGTSSPGFPAAGEPLAWPWSTLRSPASTADWMSTTERPGWLRLRGMRSTDSLRDQSLIAQRITSEALSASVVLDAAPENYTQSAGLIFYYNTAAYFYLRLSVRDTEESLERVLEVWERDAEKGLLVHATAVVPDSGPLRLSATMTPSEVQFAWGAGDGGLQQLAAGLNATHLSDDYGKTLRFTGPFVGVCAQDLRDQSFCADFSEFTLVPLGKSAR
jgi:xylan 1,4-beta-xylosidase